MVTDFEEPKRVFCFCTLNIILNYATLLLSVSIIRIYSIFFNYNMINEKLTAI